MEEGEGAGRKKAWEQRHTAAAKVVASKTLVVFIRNWLWCGGISKCVKCGVNQGVGSASESAEYLWERRGSTTHTHRESENTHTREQGNPCTCRSGCPPIHIGLAIYFDPIITSF